MASPPFDIAQTTPADNDFVSPYPGVERTFRDVVESWLKIEHNVQGRHDRVTLDWPADPAAELAVTPANTTRIIAAAELGGQLVFSREGEPPEFLGVVPGTVVDYASDSIPDGYLLCDGSAVSRDTYAVLFVVIGTTFGAGNGSTTFNVPDLRGRTTIGKDDMGGVAAGRVTNGVSGFEATTLGAAGGFESHTLVVGEIPAHQHTGTTGGQSQDHTHPQLASSSVGSYAGGGSNGPLGNGSNTGGTSNDHTHDFTTDNAGGGGAHRNVQPSMVMNKIIKW